MKLLPHLLLLLPCLAGAGPAQAAPTTPILATAGASATPPAGGESVRAPSPSSAVSYATRLRDAIRRHLDLPAERAAQAALLANPMAEVEVKTAPDGRIVGMRLSRPSGVPEWDAAVLRAVERTQSLPLDNEGRVPPVLYVAFAFRPRS